MSETRMLVIPKIEPPPKPWNARAVINQVIFLAAPQRAEKAKNVTMAAYRTGFRPMMSDTLPLIGV